MYLKQLKFSYNLLKKDSKAHVNIMKCKITFLKLFSIDLESTFLYYLSIVPMFTLGS